MLSNCYQRQAVLLLASPDLIFVCSHSCTLSNLAFGLGNVYTFITLQGSLRTGSCCLSMR